MKSSRITPAGLETANTRGGGLRYHEPVDNSVESLNVEDIPYGSSHWTGQLMEDMRNLDQPRLEKLYRELVFGFHQGRDEPKQRDYRVMLHDSRGRCRGWRWASWRGAILP